MATRTLGLTRQPILGGERANHKAENGGSCQPLDLADVQAELTKLLLHGYGSLTVKVHAHRITALETTTRMLSGKGEEASF